MDVTNSLPVLYIRAKNHYDVGFTIGRTFGGWIKDYLATSSDVKMFQKFYDNSQGRKYVEEYLSTGSKSHPNIMSEVRGMADGADVKFEDLFLLQISSEIKFCHFKDVFQEMNDGGRDGKGYTDVMVNRKQGRFIGHNDDWTQDVSPWVYMVHVTITNDQDHVIEQFVSFSYPGYLVGFCFGFNESLVITLNTLLPRKSYPRGIPIAILLRSLLACKSITECAAAMKGEPYGSAYGMNINISSIQGLDMCSIEVYPNKVSTVIKNLYIPPGEVSDTSCVFFHQNHYKHIVAEEIGPCTGSRRRDKRASEMSDIQTIDDIRAVLGDTADTIEPIYRVPCESHIAPDVKTAATAIFDINQRVLHVYRSNPKLASVPCVTIPFL